MAIDGEDGWVPAACTIPTAERPLRVAEFDGLFAGGLRHLERLGPMQLRLVLEAGVEASARDLAVREVGCCSFFGFAFSAAEGGQVLLDVTVSQANVDVLDALATRAASAAGLSV